MYIILYVRMLNVHMLYVHIYNVTQQKLCYENFRSFEGTFLRTKSKEKYLLILI